MKERLKDKEVISPSHIPKNVIPNEATVNQLNKLRNRESK